MVKAKQKGGKGLVEAPEPEDTNVIDLMAALRNSLKGPASGGAGKKAPAKKAAPKKTAARKPASKKAPAKKAPARKKAA